MSVLKLYIFTDFGLLFEIFQLQKNEYLSSSIQFTENSERVIPLKGMIREQTYITNIR